MSFQTFDTETINRKGFGQACLLIASRPDGTIKTREFPKSFAGVFSFLASKPRPTYVCYNMDFDTRAIVHPNFLPFRVVEEVGLFGRAEHRGMRFQFIPGKFLEVRGPGVGRNGFMLNDLAQFYGMSLAAASAKYLPGNEKLPFPKSWYNQMDKCLTDHRRARTMAYAIQDVRSTEGLKDILLNSLAALGIKTKRLSSCASLARARHGHILERVRAPDYINKIFERGFFGGRIECNRLGVVKGVKLYDINSAYPSEIAKLKDPTKGEHVESSNGSRRKRSPDYGLYLVESSIPRGEVFGPLAMRSHGKVFYPVGSIRTWACLPGIEALREARFPFKILKAYEIFDCPKEPILPDIEELYKARKHPDGSPTDAQLAIKLLINSDYGLTAEATNYLAEDPTGGRLAGSHSVTSRSRYGKLTNFVLASQITEAVRMRLWKEARRMGNDVHFMATDGLLVRDTRSLPCGPGLGEWGLKGTFESATILGCGRYLLRGKSGAPVGHDEEFHLRGFPVRRELFDKLARCKRKRAYIKTLDTLSLREWASDLLADSLNVLAPSSKRLEVNDEKRYWLKTFPAVKDYFTGTVESKPFIVGRPGDFQP